MRRTRRLVRLLNWTIIGVATAAIGVAVVIPRLGGAHTYTVVTGSMQPTLPPGTLVVAKPAEPKSIEPGDVVTYQLHSAKATMVTHRIVNVGSNLKGELRYTTQGDANSAADPETVRPIQIQGKLWYSVPYLGYATGSNERQFLANTIIALLVAYAAFMFVGAIGDKSRKVNL